MRLREIEVVEDRTASVGSDEGFLRVARLRLRNLYEDGSRSEPYACDVVSRPGSDAVVAVLYEVEGSRRVRVLLRESPRPPVYLRRHKRLVHPDAREYRALAEVVAGLVEADDPPGEAGLQRRAALEAREEAGCRVPEAQFARLGDALFASPGTSDEKVFYRAAPAALDAREEARGDGSVMEEGGRAVLRELAEAIEACRCGEIPDMKTEVALLRLADHLAFLPQLGLFADELPPALRARYRPLGAGAPRGAAGDESEAG